MSAITTLGVDSLSLRGAGSEYNRFSRFFRTRAEAQDAINSGNWTPEPGVANACLTADEGVLYWNDSTSVLENADDATREYINTQIAALVGDAPALLDQLNEIADAIGDDSDFITTINTKIDTDVNTERARAELAEQTLTTDLATEVTRATAAETANATAIADIQDGYDFTGKITAPVTDNVIPFLYADQSAFPAAADVHGAIAHSHADGAIYFAHAGAWHKLANDVDVVANATAIATETSRAVTAEQAIDARLDVLEADPTTATAVAAVQADVDQNEADSDAAEAALSARLDVLEADPTTATALAAVQADVDQNEADSDAAEAALSARLDVLEADPTTKAYVDAEVAGLIDSAPGALDTLNELAAAMGDDANFATTVTNQIAVVQADVDQNEADADAADVALGGRIDAVEAEIDTARTNIYTALGQTESAQAMGTFTGSTLSDNTTVRSLLQELETATELRATIADTVLTGITEAKGVLNVGNDGLNSGYYVKFQRNGNTQFDFLARNIPSGGTLNINNSNGNNAKVVVYSEEFWVRNLGGNNGNGKAKFDGEVTFVDSFLLDGTKVTATGAELNFVDGVTSNIQTQLDAIQADVDQNESDVDTAIAAVQADVDQNEADADAAIALKADIASPTFTGTPAAPTAGAGTNTTQLATTAFVTTAVANVIDSAPGALDTLNELAAALGDDANFATTITNSIAAVQADVDQNELDSDNADTALSNRITTLEADPVTKSYVDGHSSTEAAARTAADDALDTRIDNLEDGTTNFTGFQLAGTSVTATGAELNYVDGVTSNIQTQLDAIQADVDQNESDADAAICTQT